MAGAPPGPRLPERSMTPPTPIAKSPRDRKGDKLNGIKIPNPNRQNELQIRQKLYISMYVHASLDDNHRHRP